MKRTITVGVTLILAGAAHAQSTSAAGLVVPIGNTVEAWQVGPGRIDVENIHNCPCDLWWVSPDLLEWVQDWGQDSPHNGWLSYISANATGPRQTIKPSPGALMHWGFTDTSFNGVWAGPCDADFNGEINSSDYYTFIAAFLAGDADFNLDGVTNTSDLFDFVECLW